MISLATIPRRLRCLVPPGAKRSAVRSQPSLSAWAMAIARYAQSPAPPLGITSKVFSRATCTGTFIEVSSCAPVGTSAGTGVAAASVATSGPSSVRAAAAATVGLAPGCSAALALPALALALAGVGFLAESGAAAASLGVGSGVAPQTDLVAATTLAFLEFWQTAGAMMMPEEKDSD